MMGFLFQKEVLPSLIIANPTGYEIQLTKDNPVRESWMGIYFKDKKIGFSNTVVSQDVDRGIAGYRIDETTLLKLNMLGEQRLIRVRGSSFFSEDYILKNFDYKFISGEYRLDVSGDVSSDNLNLTIDICGERKERSFKIKQNTLISNSISPILLFKKLDVNKEINFEVFDPITFGTNMVSIKNIGREVLEFSGTRYDTYVFETDVSGIKTKTWMRVDGDILKEESGLGFTMQKECLDNVLDIAGSLSFDAQDLVSEFSVLSDAVIMAPRDVSYLKIEKNDTVIEILKDKEPLKENILSIPIEAVQEEDFVQSRDKRIIELARKIIGDEKESWVAAKKILDWVYDNIKKVPTLSVPSSVDVLRTMQGDCNEHTVLYTALTRSIGIPTKMVAGLVYLESSFYYHAWPKVYVGEWINMDPTLGQDIADATHIPLLEGGLKEQLELVKIIGNFKIKILEYR
jgi:hypothetical protein